MDYRVRVLLGALALQMAFGSSNAGPACTFRLGLIAGNTIKLVDFLPGFLARQFGLVEARKLVAGRTDPFRESAGCSKISSRSRHVSFHLFALAEQQAQFQSQPYAGLFVFVFVIAAFAVRGHGRGHIRRHQFAFEEDIAQLTAGRTAESVTAPIQKFYAAGNVFLHGFSHKIEFRQFIACRTGVYP
jgi:hypothetical protein